MDLNTLQAIIRQTQARLGADRDEMLAAMGMPSALALHCLELLRALHADADQDEVSDLLLQLLHGNKEQRKVLRGAMQGDLRARLQQLARDADLRIACQALLDSIQGSSNAAPTATISGTAIGPVVGLNTGSVATTYTGNPTTQQMTASEGSTLSHNRQVTQGPNSVYHEAPPDPAAERAEQALRQYLRLTLESCSVLPLSALDATDAEQKPLELEHVYIGLHTSTQVQVPEAERQSQAGRRQPETRPLTALEAVQRAPAGRLILRGAPGSGKSTFVSHLALCLAGAALQEREPATTTPEGGWLGCLSRWQGGALLPIRVILRDFAASPAVAQASKGTVELLQQFIQGTLQEAGCAEAWVPLQADLVNGQALLLLDGLDEVVGTPVLKNVAQSIVQFAVPVPDKLIHLVVGQIRQRFDGKAR